MSGDNYASCCTALGAGWLAGWLPAGRSHRSKRYADILIGLEDLNTSDLFDPAEAEAESESIV